jgi:hypothetical protein
MSDSPLHSTYLASSGVVFSWSRKHGVPTDRSSSAGWQPLYLVGFGQEPNGESL